MAIGARLDVTGQYFGGLMHPEGMQIVGDKALIAALNALPERVYRKVLRQSMGRAAKPMKAAMRRRARKHAGKGQRKTKDGRLLEHLYKTIIHRNRTYLSESTILCTVGPKWPQGAHGHLLEWGHDTRGAPRIVAGSQKKGHFRFSGFGTPERVRGYPWMKPAYNATKHKVLAILQRELVQKVETEAAKLGRTNA